jgi:hypothetical protein
MAAIRIDGAKYELAFNFTIGEARTIKRYSGLTLNQLEGDNLTDPDVIAALMHIAVKRTNPAWSESAVEQFVNNVEIAKIEWEGDEDDAASPPASSNVVSETSTGEDGSALSGLYPEPSNPNGTGTSPSDTSHISAPVTSVP